MSSPIFQLKHIKSVVGVNKRQESGLVSTIYYGIKVY